MYYFDCFIYDICRSFDLYVLVHCCILAPSRSAPGRPKPTPRRRLRGSDCPVCITIMSILIIIIIIIMISIILGGNTCLTPLL